jgi:hypothetical protein
MFFIRLRKFAESVLVSKFHYINLAPWSLKIMVYKALNGYVHGGFT